ncbi:MAG TPA: SusC/RagA family TonB-linked outer membrane protein, partial [Rikenellaceae bacterium]|nr:SusC/RagA family TonB-linked outer membrane protein [Rikenellaceae bacterium]
MDTEGHPVVGATVIISGTTTGVSTDTEGRYNISAPVNGKFLVSCLGYDDVVVDIAKRSVVDITLTESTAALDEVTVVAYGTKRKQDLVGSVSSVKKDIISNAQTASISSALEGSVAGLQIISSSGQPGDDASIVIRGTGSMSASNSALIVVDGVPYNGSISDINPSDIESISVSKDAVSNSLYGSRAAGGVVMITTKSGKGGKFNVQFTGTWGMSQRAYKDYDMATDPGEFYRLTWYGMRNTYWAAGNSLEDSAAGASANLLDELGNYNAFIIPDGEYLVTPDGALNANARLRYDDTFADAMFKSSFRQEYNVSASGGNDKTNYYMSIGYLDNDSYIVGSSYNRLTARVNVDSQVKKWLRVGTNIGYAKTTKLGVNDSNGKASNPFEVARSWAPIFPVHAYDAEGNVKLDSAGNPIYDAGTGQTDGTSERPVATNQNVVANLNEDIRKSEHNN